MEIEISFEIFPPVEVWGEIVDVLRMIWSQTGVYLT